MWGLLLIFLFVSMVGLRDISTPSSWVCSVLFALLKKTLLFLGFCTTWLFLC